MEIKVREYVRTYNGKIGKVFHITERGQGVRYAGEFITDTIISISTDKVGEIRLKEKDIVSHSFNIIDLIEVNDFVNGHRVANIKNDEGRIEIGLETDHMINYYIEKEDIKTILTYEQHERNFYRLD